LSLAKRNMRSCEDSIYVSLKRAKVVNATLERGQATLPNLQITVRPPGFPTVYETTLIMRSLRVPLPALPVGTSNHSYRREFQTDPLRLGRFWSGGPLK